MHKKFTCFLLAAISFIFHQQSYAQLQITDHPNVQALAQRLVGEGLTISNVTFTGNPMMAGFFKNSGSTNILIDSGIILTNGRARTQGFARGVNGNGTTTAEFADAHNALGLPGDANLSTIISGPTEDACVLEFDFVPLGDSIKFKYVLSSEEYNPAYVCDFNDAFAFIISGPGFATPRNIALIPGTTTPVTITNVNDVPDGDCPNNMTYYIDNLSNKFLTHDGLTKTLTALARVQPCETYHLKLVIADAGGDDDFDSGVFLEAKSLSSNAITLSNLTQTDASGLSYLVEGCATGTVKITRPFADPNPQTIYFSYAGTATNSVDVQTLPASITIPANQESVFLNINPLVDNLTEGTEILKIYTIAPCASAIPIDSTIIQIRDYDTLGLTPGMHPDTAFICRNATVVLTATPGFSNYNWDANATLSATNTRIVSATPTSLYTKYYCTATEGTCNARDSINVKWKTFELVSKSDVNCANASTGSIRTSGGREWVAPLQFSINNGPAQADSNFNNLPVGSYTVKITDATGCVDSVTVAIAQAFPNLTASLSAVQPSCSGGADGSITVTAGGGRAPYTYSSNGITYQSGNTFSLGTGLQTIYVKDANGCITTRQQTLTFVNTVMVDAGDAVSICEGNSTTLAAVTNGTTVAWTPAQAISGSTSLTPTVSPVVTTKYYVTATTGICTKVDSVIVTVNPAPVPNAGPDVTVCYGGNAMLNGSGGTQFTWTPGTYLSSTTVASPEIRRPINNVTYYLQVKDANGCSSLRNDTVVLKVTPPIAINAIRDTMVAINQPVQLLAIDVNNSGITTWNWNSSNGPGYRLNNPAIANPISTPDRDINYYVTVKTVNNCEGADTIKVKVYQGPEIYVPSTFTPNGDGINDVLHAIGIGMKEFHYFRIYNRWGQLIHSARNFTDGWNGMWQGKPMNMGVYVWIAEAVDFRGNIIQRKGTTMIMQ